MRNFPAHRITRELFRRGHERHRETGHGGANVAVEQRAGPFFPQKRHGILTFHPEIGQHQSCDQSRPVETHATVRQNFLAVGHQSSPELRQRVQLVQIRQVLIVDGKVDIEHVIGNVWNAQVEITVQVYHRSNAMFLNRLPVIDRRGNKQLTLLIS